MPDPSIWIAALPQPRIARHFPAHGIPDVGRVMSLRAVVRPGQAPHATLVPFSMPFVGNKVSLGP
jgi:hypothetical protein